MTNDLVSIIVPIYNVADYLDNCIRSACNQTYKNIEIILVDDGSTDASPEICDNWAKKDHRIKVIHKENSGLSDARNAGLDVATGIYILFLDGDDGISKDLLYTALPYMSENTDMVAFGYTLVFNGRKNENVVFEKKRYQFNSESDKLDFIVNPFFKHKLGWSVWNRILRKNIIDSYNLRFIDNRRIFAEDQCFCLMYIAHCQKIAVISDCLYNYYQRNNSIMNEVKKNNSLKFGEKNELAIEVKKHFSKYNDCRFLVKYHSIIHFLLIEREIQSQEDSNCWKTSELRKIIIDDIKKKSDYNFLIETLTNFSEHKKVLRRKYGIIRMLEKTGRAKWLLTGHSFWYTLLVKLRKKLD